MQFPVLDFGIDHYVSEPFILYISSQSATCSWCLDTCRHTVCSDDDHKANSFHPVMKTVSLAFEFRAASFTVITKLR